jgi:hypothetical protein
MRYNSNSDSDRRSSLPTSESALDRRPSSAAELRLVLPRRRKRSEYEEDIEPVNTNSLIHRPLAKV